MASDESNITVEGDVELYSHETEIYVQASKRPICIDWAMHTDAELSDGAAASGRGYTTSDIDYTFKVSTQRFSRSRTQHHQVDATGLEPFTTYYYQFTVCDTNITSPVGRTKTIPSEDDEVPLSLGVFSCAKYHRGYFNAYGNAARKDTIDYMVHLGDYFYEEEGGEEGEGPRVMQPVREIKSLHDFRTRIGQYRTDEDLQLAHQNYPWITVWDDHEISNNNWRAGSSQMNNTEESFIEFGGISFDTLKMNAVRSYFEWMPIRQADLDDNLRIWRNFKMGKLFDLIMLDTRAYDRSISSLRWNNDHVGEDLSNDASRTLMGGRQEKWFYRQLSESAERGATWKVVGNQVIFSHRNQSGIDEGSPLFPSSPDEWDGYVANRNRTLKHVVNNNLNNMIMLAGDSHASTWSWH
jgi:alkaline phosphatase D